MMFAQPSSTTLCQRLNAIMTRWHGLIQIVRNPYRPELHYMRGPGPKWRAKHQGHSESSAPWLHIYQDDYEIGS